MHDSLLLHVPSINAPFQEVARIYKAVRSQMHTHIHVYIHSRRTLMDIKMSIGTRAIRNILTFLKLKKVALAYMSIDQNVNNYAISLPYGIDMDNGGFTTANQSYFQLLEAETIVTLHVFQKSITRTWKRTKFRTHLQGDSDIRASSG